MYWLGLIWVGCDAKAVNSPNIRAELQIKMVASPRNHRYRASLNRISFKVTGAAIGGHRSRATLLGVNLSENGGPGGRRVMEVIERKGPLTYSHRPD